MTITQSKKLFAGGVLDSSANEKDGKNAMRDDINIYDEQVLEF